MYNYGRRECKVHLSELTQKIGSYTSTSAGAASLVLADNFNWLPDASVDFILTDPPFNIARDTNFHTYEGNTINSFRFDADKGWDSYTPENFRQLLAAWSLEFYRVLRPGGSFAVFCADEYLSHFIDALRASGLKPRRTVTWRKPNAVPVNRKHMMMSACEYIIVGVKGSNSVFNVNIDPQETSELADQEIVAIADKAATVIEQELRNQLRSIAGRPSPTEVAILVEKTLIGSASGVANRAINIFSEDGVTSELCVPNQVNFNSKSGKRLHPTEKPIQLLKYLINLFSRPGDLVLDPFAGSASTGESALETGRQVILVERDLDFFALGSARIISVASGLESRLI
jgi:DNA modification methylase